MAYDGDGGEDGMEFAAIARDVYDRLSEEDDPGLVLAVDEWLTKLTGPDDRGPDELNYLKLLRCMMANRRIGRPFRRPPPAGRLLPLHAFLRPTRPVVGDVTSDTLPPPSRRVRPFRCWRTVSSSRGSQTHDYDFDDYDDYDDYDDEDDHDEDDGGGGGGGNDRPETAEEKSPAPAGNGSQEGATTGEDDWPTIERENSNADDVENAERDGHLVAGGNASTDLHDSCFDWMGLHSRKSYPDSLDAVYKNLSMDVSSSSRKPNA